MKKFYLLLFILSFQVNSILAQAYPSENVSLIGFINPNNGNLGVASDGERYSGCYGWYQANKNKEYAISGTSNGVYFIDVTSPASPSVSAFVQGKPACTWREMATYQNYCYIISDDFPPNSFQIVDMQYLPDSVHIVYNGVNYFERSHRLFIDGNKLYTSGVTYTYGANPSSSSMDVYSLATPTAPVLLRRLSQDVPFVSYVHDMYVRNDTVFASCGYQGLFIFKFNSGVNTFTQLGSYTGYPNSGYNHSSFLTQNGKYLVFCDEVPSARPIHIVDVQNLGNIIGVQMFKPYPQTTPHNPYLLGNNLAVLSCYEDGLNIYNISQPVSPCLVGHFDTYPQGGGNNGNYSPSHPYRGNWGAYPYLPSGIIIANDMQNGVFILNPTAAYSSSNCVTLGVNSKAENSNANLFFYPNPASNRIAVHFENNDKSVLQIKTVMGQLVFEKKYDSSISDYISVSDLANGTYIISVTEQGKSVNKKLIVNN